MDGLLKCKICGGYVKYVKHSEKFLDEEGHTKDSDTDEVCYYKCNRCGKTTSNLDELSKLGD